jgi:hypothetical protein
METAAMILFCRNKQATEFIATEVQRVNSLLADMERILEGHAPEEVPCADPPILDQWNLNNRPAPCLVGLSTGHPKLPGTNREIVTSEVWLMSDDMAWARTLSRWYRLGRPAFKPVDA